MATVKLSITCTQCGEEFHHVKKGLKSRDVENYEKWVARNITLCSECQKKEQLKAREENEAMIAKEGLAILEKHGIKLPELQGSEKQIAWANSIRLERIYSEQRTFIYALNHLGNKIDEEYLNKLGELGPFSMLREMVELLTTQSAARVIDIKKGRR